MGKTAKKIGNIAGRSALGFVTGGGSELARLAPQKTVLGRLGRIPDALTGTMPQEDNTLYGDFKISPEEIAYNKQMIMDEGNKQFDQMTKEGSSQIDLRKNRRQELASLLSNVAQKNFMRELPNIAENANAGGVYTGTGFSEALARERAKNIQDVQDTLAQQALTDVDAEIANRNAALGKRLGFQDSALSRQFSLEDFIRSANVAKQTGKELMPRSDGKSGTGSILQGIGSIGKLFV